ncbi:MAG: hypothetical protein WB681_07475 [Candidatus Cybelea sp.]
MDVSDSKELRRSILQVTLDKIDGRENGHWFVPGFLGEFDLERSDDNLRRVQREIQYLAEKQMIKAVPGAGTYAVTGITALGRDYLDAH